MKLISQAWLKPRKIYRGEQNCFIHTHTQKGERSVGAAFSVQLILKNTTNAKCKEGGRERIKNLYREISIRLPLSLQRSPASRWVVVANFFFLLLLLLLFVRFFVSIPPPLLFSLCSSSVLYPWIDSMFPFIYKYTSKQAACCCCWLPRFYSPLFKATNPTLINWERWTVPRCGHMSYYVASKGERYEGGGGS